MKSLKNSVQLIGRLGKDPEMKNLDGGKVFTTFSLATNESYTNQKGEKVEEVQWHTINVWGKTAEFASKYLKKGGEVAVEGRLVHRNYETSSGEKRYVTDIAVNELILFGGK